MMTEDSLPMSRVSLETLRGERYGDSPGPVHGGGVAEAKRVALAQALVTAALVALLGLAGWALYATGWTDGYAEAVLDYEEDTAPAVLGEVRA